MAARTDSLPRVRWPSGLAKHHKYAMAGVRQGNHLMLRSHDCGTPNAKICESVQSPAHYCPRRQKHTYAYGTAQYHWGKPPGQWVLFDVKKIRMPERSVRSKARTHFKACPLHDQWWDKAYSEMIAAGGDWAILTMLVEKRPS